MPSPSTDHLVLDALRGRWATGRHPRGLKSDELARMCRRPWQDVLAALQRLRAAGKARQAKDRWESGPPPATAR